MFLGPGRAVCAAAAIAAALAGCGAPGVVRVVDGRAIEGRFISDTAYASYARASDAEAHGDATSALRAFEEAAAEDPESAAIWSRIGALRCRAARRPDDAREAFDRAAQIDPEYEPLWRERARCLLGGGEIAPALASAERAVELDPDDEEATTLRAAALERLGRAVEARRALAAFTLRHPASTAAWRARYDLARRAGDAPLAERSAARLAELSPGLRDELAREVPSLAPLAAIDAALRAGDLAAARHLALRARIPPSEVALRAVALGKPRLGREQADLVTAADPADTSARIALAAAADLLNDATAIADAMRAIPLHVTGASPLARLLLAEVLARRVGTEAARTWLGAPPDPGSDALLAATAARVRARLAPR